MKRFLACLLFAAVPLAAQQSRANPTAGLERHAGFIPFYFDDKTGRLLFEIDRLDQDFLYTYALSTGLGSNDRGLDRSSLGDEAVVRFQRFGPRIFLVRRNTAFRGTRDTVEQRTVEESFATSVLAGLPIVSEDSGRIVVDASDFVLQDVFNVRGNLARSQQGTYRLDRNRSAVYLPRTKAFPKNTEVEVLLTMETDAPGNDVARHTPDARALTLREHHSFVELPDDNYKPRAFDPRVGIFALGFMDFSHPFNRPPDVRWLQRWRLEKKDPTAAISEPVKPIVYYLDRGVPEPYRTAFKQGAAWWNTTFEAAGFRNAFRVEDMPDDMDPMDARYSVIQWVHRSTPGFSVGQSFADPRTGEIIKAALKMDTYRSITDFNMFAGMEPATDDATADWITSLDPKVNGFEYAMSRRRQHVAHEIGHTLGLAHNYISHTYGRASVMDYPGPLVTLKPNGTVDVSQAYRAGTGSYDSLAIRYAYTQFASAAGEKAGLADIMKGALANGIRFLSDRDADAGVTPEITRWLNGADAVKELQRETAVRDVLLARFNETVIANGDPMWMLNERLVPVYLHHRYAIEGSIKAVGGQEYTFALRGDGQVPAAIVAPVKQREALSELLKAISPKELAIPERIVAKLPPSPYGINGGWSFDSPAGIVFDPLAVARALSAYVADGLLQPDRVERMIVQHARMSSAPSADEVIGTMINTVYAAPATSSYELALRRAARRSVVDAVIGLAANPRATPDARAAAEQQISGLATRLASATTGDAEDRAANAAVVRDARNWLDRRIAPPRSLGLIQLPPGTPIGH